MATATAGSARQHRCRFQIEERHQQADRALPLLLNSGGAGGFPGQFRNGLAMRHSTALL